MTKKRLNIRIIMLLLGVILGAVSIGAGIHYLVPVLEQGKADELKVQELTKNLEDIRKDLAGKTKEFQEARDEVKKKEDEIAAFKSSIEGSNSKEEELLQSIKELEEAKKQSEDEVARRDEEMRKLESDLTVSFTGKLQAGARRLSEITGYFYELKEMDDSILRDSDDMVAGFMEIADTGTFEKKTRSARDEVYTKLMTLTNRLESEKKSRELFLRSVRKKYRK